MHKINLLSIMLVVATLSTACATSSGKPGGYDDLTPWQKSNASSVEGLWHGTQTCGSGSAPMELLVGLRATGTQSYDVVVVAAKTSSRPQVSRWDTTVELGPDNAGAALPSGWKGRIMAILQPKPLIVGGLTPDGNLKAKLVDQFYKKRAWEDRRCPLSSLTRVLDGNAGNILANGIVVDQSFLAQRRATTGQRADLAGTWQGVGVCRAQRPAAQLTLSLNPNARWGATFVSRGKTSTYVLAPDLSGGSGANYKFIDNPPKSDDRLHTQALIRLTGVIERDGAARWLKVTSGAGCIHTLLYRHQPLEGLGGSYASSGGLNEMCQAVASDWLGNPAAEMAAANQLKRKYPQALSSYRPSEVKTAALRDPARFTRTFGIEPGQLTEPSYHALARQLASCATIGPATLRDEFANTLFPGTRLKIPRDSQIVPNWNPADDIGLTWTHSQFAQLFSAPPVEAFDQLIATGLNARSVRALDTEINRSAGTLNRLAPAMIRTKFVGLMKHRESMASDETKARTARIAREGAPKLNIARLQHAVHARISVSDQPSIPFHQ